MIWVLPLQGHEPAARQVPVARLSSARVVIYESDYKPTHFYPDNRVVAKDIQWHLWNAIKAIGTGMTTACAPGNVDCTTVRQWITYTKPSRVCGAVTFAHFTFSQWRVYCYLEGCNWYYANRR